MMTLDHPGFTVAEAEKLAGLPKNTMYKLIRRGDVRAGVDVVGQYRIEYGELYTFLKNREAT